MIVHSKAFLFLDRRCHCTLGFASIFSYPCCVPLYTLFISYSHPLPQRQPSAKMVLSAIHKDNEHGIPHYMGLSGRRLGLAVSTIATCGFLLFGYDQGVMSGIISAPAFNDAFPDTRDNPTWQGFVTSIYEIGCLIGAIFILCFGDKTGRRRAIALGGVIMILGVIIQVSAIPGHSAEAQFIIGRVVTGVGNGINTSTIPTYQAECSRSTNRGLLICIEGGIIAFGTLIAYWIDYGCSYGPADLVWRFPIAYVHPPSILHCMKHSLTTRLCRF